MANDFKSRGPCRTHQKTAREPDAKNDFFHFGKILVYGKKLY